MTKAEEEKFMFTCPITGALFLTPVTIIVDEDEKQKRNPRVPVVPQMYEKVALKSWMKLKCKGNAAGKFRAPLTNENASCGVELVPASEEFKEKLEQFVAEHPELDRNEYVPDFEQKIGANGTKAWYRDDVLHREEGPAIEYADGSTAWFWDGKLHREKGPAIKYVNGSEMWYWDGKLHNENGPAIIDVPGRREKWYWDGKLHRKDAPAIIIYNSDHHHHLDEWDKDGFDGTKEWYWDGKRHRENGPAIERADGTKEWYWDGRKLPDPSESQPMRSIS